MTVGETIQKYRKALGMSQEELGHKLLVSRQTVSLWETDQTVPTIDNLIRLREVFHVSVDEILGIESDGTGSEIEANETYQFRFTKAEMDEIYRLQRGKIYKRPILFTAISVCLILFLMGLSTPKSLIGFAFGLLFLGLVSHIKAIRAYRKAWAKNVERVCESTYEYTIFEKYIGINIYRKNEKIRESKCFYTEIEQIHQFEKWLLIQFGGQTFIVRKSDLRENSALFSYMYINPSKTVGSAVPNKWRIASELLFVASLFSIFGAMALMSAVSNSNMLSVENTWVFFLLTPIPIASMVLGFVLKSKGYKYKKNVIAGIIMTALLCIYGAFSFIFASVYDHSDEPILRVEQMTGIDIPEHKQISTQDWTKGTQSVSRGYIYYTSTVYFEKAAANEFEKQLAADEKWLSTVSSDFIGITSPFGDHGGYDYMLIYNIDTSEFNTLPHAGGTFRFINLLYQAENDCMEIVEYSIDYVK